MIISLIPLFWILGVVICFGYQRRKRLKGFTGTDPGRKAVIESFEIKIKLKLFGFNPSDAFLIWANIILSLFAVFTFIDSKNQSTLLHRAYIGINSEINTLSDHSIDKQGQIDSGGIRLKLKIKNYGDLPTNFSAQLIGWPVNKIRAFQNIQNYIMPGQEIELEWNIDYSNIDPKLISDCSLFDGISINILYLNHNLKIIPKLIEDPRYNRDKNDKFQVLMYNCPSGVAPQVLTWYVQEIN